MIFIPQVDAKLSRALLLINDLESLCNSYLNSNDFYLEKVPVEPNKWKLILRMNETLPLELGVLVGDIVHNLRSSLDIGFFQILQTANPERFSLLSKWELSAIKFPIFDSEVDFSRDKWHGGLAEAQLLLDLREVQPFRNLELFESLVDYTNIIESSPLWHLHTLWNMDKHRGINLVIGGLDMLALGLDEGQESVWTQKDAPPWRDGSKIYTVEIKSGAEVPTLKLSETFAIGLESDVRPLQIYPIFSKLQGLLGTTNHCHWIMKRWFENR